jgi:hypothetical protein
LLVRDETKGAFMAKRQDDMDMPQRSGERDRDDDMTRGTGIEDVRGIARDEDDDFEEADDLDESDDDESEDL